MHREVAADVHARLPNPGRGQKRDRSVGGHALGDAANVETDSGGQANAALLDVDRDTAPGARTPQVRGPRSRRRHRFEAPVVARVHKGPEDRRVVEAAASAPAPSRSGDGGARAQVGRLRGHSGSGVRCPGERGSGSPPTPRTARRRRRRPAREPPATSRPPRSPFGDAPTAACLVAPAPHRTAVLAAAGAAVPWPPATLPAPEPNPCPSGSAPKHALAAAPPPLPRRHRRRRPAPSRR